METSPFPTAPSHRHRSIRASSSCCLSHSGVPSSMAFVSAPTPSICAISMALQTLEYRGEIPARSISSSLFLRCSLEIASTSICPQYVMICGRVQCSPHWHLPLVAAGFRGRVEKSLPRLPVSNSIGYDSESICQGNLCACRFTIPILLVQPSTPRCQEEAPSDLSWSLPVCKSFPVPWSESNTAPGCAPQFL